jgi:hypothetical protein
MSKISVEEVECRLMSIHGDTVKIDRDTYTGTSKKAFFIDVDFGRWEAYVHNILVGHCHILRGKSNRQKTNLKKYGSVSPLGGILCRQKIESTNLKKYGVKHAMQSDIVREHYRQSVIEKYGVDNVQKVKEIREKTHQTCLSRYGVDAPLQSLDVMKKSKQTCLERYGCEYSQQSSEVREKSKQTCLKRYGVENVMQNPELFKRMQRSKRKSITLKHWKTNEEIICVGTYEYSVVNWLNQNKIDYDWQVTFKIPNDENLGSIKGKSYTVDLFVKGQNSVISVGTYVEIKGWWMQKSSKLKWEWFLSLLTNSSVWMKHE